MYDARGHIQLLFALTVPYCSYLIVIGLHLHPNIVTYVMAVETRRDKNPLSPPPLRPSPFNALVSFQLSNNPHYLQKCVKF